MRHLTLAFSFVWSVGSLSFGQTQPPPDQTEEVPFQEERKRLQLTAVLDFRLAETSAPLGFFDRGLGKTRYGGDGIRSQTRGRVAQASILFRSDWTDHLTSHLHVNFDLEPKSDFEVPDASLGGLRIDPIEAFLRLRAPLGTAWELAVKAGLFFPPITLEHPGLAWTTVYTITPSAVNSWIGEEVRASGAEARLTRSGLENEIAVLAAAFVNNDPTASLLAYRGFALHDRQTALFDKIPLAPIPAIEPGGIFEGQAPYDEPLKELDDRIGYYGGLSWENFNYFLVNALYFDNGGVPDVFDGAQYSWKTDFINIGAIAFLPAGIELLGQYLDGDTRMGFDPPGEPKVVFGFRAGYGLLSLPLGRHRLSLRYDRFRIEDRDEFVLEDNNNESGSAWTIAYLIRTGERHRLALELLRNESERAARRGLGLEPSSTDYLFQVSFRLLIGHLE